MLSPFSRPRHLLHALSGLPCSTPPLVRSTRLTAAALAMPLLFLVMGVVLAPAGAQEPLPSTDSSLSSGEIKTYVDGNVRARLKIAVPPMKRPFDVPPEASSAIDELEETLLNDLGWSGVFDVQSKDVLSVLKLTGDKEKDFVQYASLGNEVVMLGETKVEGGRLVLEGRVYDLKSGRFIVGKRYAGAYHQNRRLAHALNDEIVLYFTGRPGIAKTQIVFVSDRDGSGIKELYLMDYDGANQRRISGHRSLSLAPAWSPRNDGLAYISYFEGAPSLYWVDIESGKKSPILVDETSTMSPTFDPKGQRIAFSRALRGNWEIFTVPTQGGSATRLTQSNGIDTNPAWSPNGREMAFTSDRSGRPQIYLMDAEGTNLRRVSYSGNYNDGASWNPEGTRLLFSHRDKSGSRFDLAMVDLVTKEERILTRGLSGNHEAPAFSPDGNRIVFESDRAGGRQIFVMNADGSEVRQLTHIGSNFGPTWSNYFP